MAYIYKSIRSDTTIQPGSRKWKQAIQYTRQGWEIILVESYSILLGKKVNFRNYQQQKQKEVR
jgi:hypothetical protein